MDPKKRKEFKDEFKDAFRKAMTKDHEETESAEKVHEPGEGVVEVTEPEGEKHFDLD